MVTLETSLTLEQVGAALYGVAGTVMDVGLDYPVARVGVRQRGVYIDVLPTSGFVISLQLEQQMRSAVAAAEQTPVEQMPVKKAKRPAGA